MQLALLGIQRHQEAIQKRQPEEPIHPGRCIRQIMDGHSNIVHFSRSNRDGTDTEHIRTDAPAGGIQRNGGNGLARQETSIQRGGVGQYRDLGTGVEDQPGITRAVELGLHDQ